MYRYTVDNAVTYTSEDLVLFRESPFACWMERLTLENAGHGIAPDPGSTAPNHGALRQDDMAETLRAEGKDVLLVDWEEDESRRRAATLKGMREGADFIVNGQLALGPLSDSANLLMRTSGYSDLGDYLYIPCETQGTATRCAAFRLCFLADLLHSLQGQLPPQMLIIRGGDIVPLQTEDHIYHYRAVKHRFMQAMREFRKHRMPDPAESSHFGRWSVCANELLRQRAEKREPVWQEGVEEAAAEESPPVQQQRFAQVAPAAVGYSRSVEITRRALNTGAPPGAAVLSPGGQVPSGPTLVEQARRLAPAVPGPRGSGSTDRPTLAAAVTAEVPAALTAEEAADADRGGHRPVSDPALENLEFIGNRARQPASPALSPADPVDAEARLPTGGAIDRDEPSFIEPLPLPEVEEISLDGSLLPPEWVEAPWGEPGAATATLPDDGPRPRRPDGEAEAWRVAPADAERGEAPSTAEGARPGRAAPSPSLNPAGQWQREGAAARSPGDAGSAGSAGSSRGRDFAPRDFAPREFVPAAGLYSSVDPDSGTIASPPAGLVTSGDTAQKAPRKEGSRPLPSRGYPPREDADAPAAYPAFSDTLITSDSYDD